MQFRWLGLIVILWGALTMLTGTTGSRSLLTHNYAEVDITQVQP